MASVRRVLVIDDDDAIREVAQLTLEMIGGYEVAAAGSGPEGVRLAAADPPDAILLDMMMPDVDGPTTIALLRSQPETREVPVVLLTAKFLADETAEQQRLDVSGIIRKPFDPTALPGQLAEALGWPS